MATKWGKQASRETDARKIGLLEVPCNNPAIIEHSIISDKSAVLAEVSKPNY